MVKTSQVSGGGGGLIQEGECLFNYFGLRRGRLFKGGGLIQGITIYDIGIIQTLYTLYINGHFYHTKLLRVSVT